MSDNYFIYSLSLAIYATILEIERDQLSHFKSQAMLGDGTMSSQDLTKEVSLKYYERLGWKTK